MKCQRALLPAVRSLCFGRPCAWFRARSSSLPPSPALRPAPAQYMRTQPDREDERPGRSLRERCDHDREGACGSSACSFPASGACRPGPGQKRHSCRAQFTHQLYVGPPLAPVFASGRIRQLSKARCWITHRLGSMTHIFMQLTSSSSTLLLASLCASSLNEVFGLNAALQRPRPANQRVGACTANAVSVVRCEIALAQGIDQHWVQ